jgi:acetylglutamate kinase
MEKLFVIKIGGNVVDDSTTLNSFLQKFAAIDAFKVLVHGGGKIATAIGKKLGIEPNFINGRRITDKATIDLVTMVYAGLINKQLVATLQSMHCNAIGLTGADANIISATKRPVTDIDYGFVGDIKHGEVGTEILQAFLDNNLVPVVAPLTHDGQGQLLNTNADTIASVLAVALSGHYDVRLIYCFEKKGVLENIEDDSSVIKLINKEKYQLLLDDKKLADGILPKIDNAIAAISNGVQEVLIGHADDLLQNITENTIGTLIKS